MHLVQSKNFLPKKPRGGDALNRLVSQHQLFQFRGFKKLLKVRNFPFSRVSLGSLLLFYFLGYQPAITFPPIRQMSVQAEEPQQQAIQADSFPYSFNLPHPGYLSTSYSYYHPAIDIATGLGMPIHPIAPGKIVEVSLGLWGLGHYVVVEHLQGLKSTYGHMGRVFVHRDDEVSTSSILGEVGMTGRTTGPHTHLIVTKNEATIDPLTILPPLPSWPTQAGQSPKGAGWIKTAPTPTPTPTPKIVSKEEIMQNILWVNSPKTDGTTESKPLKLSPLLLFEVLQP